MIYIKHVRSTLKRGTDVELSPRTVIVGANGSGKSSIIQSATLATLGTVSDAEGRDDVKAQHALGRLFPPDADMWSEVTLSDGSAFRWSMARGKDGACKRPEHEAPLKVRWPVQDLMEVAKGEPTAIRAWLEKLIAAGTTLDELLKPFPPSVRSTVQHLVKKHRKTDFVSLAKEAKTESKALRTQATKAEGLIESMTEGLEAPLSDGQVAELKAKLGAMGVEEGVTQAEYDLVRTELELVVEQLVAARKVLAELPEVSVESKVQVDKLSRLHRLLTANAEFGSDNCMVCGAADAKARIAARKEAVVSGLDLKKAEVASLEERDWQTEVVTVAEARISALAAKLKSLRVRAPSAERDALIGRLAKNDLAIRAWANVTSGKRDVYDLRAQADALTTAAKALETTGKEVLERQKVAFEEKVGQFLLPGEAFGIDLDSGRFGLMRDGQLHSALSGAEWSRVLLALAVSQLAGSTPCVLAPEDRAWDSLTLTHVMQALRNSTVQIIIMSTVEPAEVEGWSIIRLG